MRTENGEKHAQLGNGESRMKNMMQIENSESKIKKYQSSEWRMCSNQKQNVLRMQNEF